MNRYYLDIDYRTGKEVYFEKHGDFYYMFEKSPYGLDCFSYNMVSKNDEDKMNYLFFQDIKARQKKRFRDAYVSGDLESIKDYKRFKKFSTKFDERRK